VRHAIILCAALAGSMPALAPAQHAAYSGQESRQIKALSAEDTKQYLSGAGMGYARAAELNHYPGPMHVLELAEKLTLTPEQRAATQRLMDTHKAEARATGAKLVEAERALDHLFASGKVDETALAQRVRAAAALQGEYRLSHLETHRRMRAILTDDQVRHYDELRGYTGSQQNHSTRKHGRQGH
jgi:Spy/CpxP family protein refolding chaperone